MGNSGRLIYASPDRRTQSSPKQLSWRKRVMLLWRIKGMVIPWDVPMTQGEREKLTQAKNLIEEVVKDFTKNSVTLGFKAVDRCYFCGKPAVTIDKNGHYVCEKCNSIYTGDVELIKQYTQRGFIRIVKNNGFQYNRHNGDHAIYVNDKGRHISIPKNLECVIARRLIKENNLITDIKRRKKMTESGYYPLGADTKDAPWNQVDNPEREIEVTVSVTLSKTVKIKVSDYGITDSGKDEDGKYFEDIDYSKCDLKRAVEEQITLPQDAYKYVKGEFDNDQYNDLKGWCVDDFEVIEE